MKPITKKILESGLVDQHAIKLFQKWGSLDEESICADGKSIDSSKEVLVEFIEEISELIETERFNVRESRLQVRMGDPVRVDMVPGGESLVVFPSQEGYLIFPLIPKYAVGSKFKFSRTNEEWVITQSTVLYHDHTPYALEVRAERV